MRRARQQAFEDRSVCGGAPIIVRSGDPVNIRAIEADPEIGEKRLGGRDRSARTDRLFQQRRLLIETIPDQTIV